MTYSTWKIEHYPITTTNLTTSNAWSTTATELTQYFDPVLQLDTGQGKDSLSFKVINFDNDFSNFFKPNDKLVISRKVNSTSVSSSDVIMVGTIQNVPEDESASQDLIRVEGTNFSEAVLSGIAFFDPNSATIPNAIQAALSAVANYNNRFKVTWSASNPSVNSTGAAFPTVSERWFNKSIKDFIVKYSTNDATLDGNYYWYVNSSNELIWRKRTNVTSGLTFNASSDDYTRLRINKDLSDVKNWVIIKGGVDPDGSPIQTRVQDASSIAKHGIRPYIITSISKNSETLVKSDKDSFGVTDMKDATYPLTPSWHGSSVANYDAYVIALRSYVSSQAELEGNAFLQGRTGGKLKLDVSFMVGKGWGRGDLVACTIPSLSSGVKNLRVISVQYTDDSDSYTLTEDIGSI